MLRRIGVNLKNRPRQTNHVRRRYSSRCPVVKHDVPGPRIAGVPSFPTIANLPDQTADRLSGRIMAPHPPMPTIALTAVEIRDLAAYILSLKQAQ